MVGTKRSVEFVVRSHNCSDILLNRHFKRQQIDLSKCALIDLTRNSAALIFGVVADEMLDTASNALRLHSFNVRSSEYAGKEWVFAHAFEIAATNRGAVKVHRRCK